MQGWCSYACPKICRELLCHVSEFHDMSKICGPISYFGSTIICLSFNSLIYFERMIWTYLDDVETSHSGQYLNRNVSKKIVTQEVHEIASVSTINTNT